MIEHIRLASFWVSFAGDTYISHDRPQRKLQRGLIAINMWFDRWNIKINEEQTEVMYLSHRFRLREDHFTLNGRNIPFVIRANYFGVTFDRRITWSLYIKMIKPRPSECFWTDPYSKRKRLNANIIPTIHETQITSVMTYAWPAWELTADTYFSQLQHLQNNVLHKKTKLYGLSPRANYTDRATAACRRSNCQCFRLEGATWSAWRIPTAVFSVF
jgi:hypothetical protein